MATKIEVKIEEGNNWKFVFHKNTKKGLHAHNGFFCKKNCKLIMAVF